MAEVSSEQSTPPKKAGTPPPPTDAQLAQFEERVITPIAAGTNGHAFGTVVTKK